MTKTFFADRATLMSPRTAKYIEAMIREGDNFDYHKWLQKVRDEEAQAKQGATAITCRDVVAAQVDDPINTSDSRDTRPTLGPAPISKPALNPRALCRSHRQAKSKTPKARCLGRVSSKSCARRGVRLPGSGLRNRRALQSAAQDQSTAAACVQICAFFIR